LTEDSNFPGKLLDLSKENDDDILNAFDMKREGDWKWLWDKDIPNEEEALKKYAADLRKKFMDFIFLFSHWRGAMTRKGLRHEMLRNDELSEETRRRKVAEVEILLLEEKIQRLEEIQRLKAAASKEKRGPRTYSRERLGSEARRMRWLP
jgi:hypothetical protein